MLVENHYDPDIGRRLAAHIRRRLIEGAYARYAAPRDLARALTLDLQSVHADRHMGVFPRRGFPSPGGAPEETRRAAQERRLRYENFGFRNVDRLAGNVGFIRLDEFAFPMLEGRNFAGDTARAAMRLVAECGALIFDLRDNFGGRPEMVRLLLGYFFDGPTHLWSEIDRRNGEREICLQAEDECGGLAEIPLFILTSSHTVSGGEMFAYLLKNRGKAMIFGEKTRGAAHKTHVLAIPDSSLDAAIPYGTIIDPLTGTNWEGSGVEPDIEVEAGRAKNTAYRYALKQRLDSCSDRARRHEIEWTLDEVNAALHPLSLAGPVLKEYAGVYGERTISADDGKAITYTRQKGKAQSLIPMGRDLFAFEDPGMFYARVRFGRDESGAVDRMILLYDTGQSSVHPKTGER